MEMKMQKVDLKPNSPEWLEWRANFRTASEAAIVMGISPFTTREKFKLIKAGLVQQYYSKAMADGHRLEQLSRDWANEQLGRDFKEEMWENGDYAASLDGIDGDTLIEIKTSAFTYNHLKEGHVENHYYFQIQQQLMCSPAEVGYLVAHNPKTGEFAISEPIEYDPEFPQIIAEAWADFEVLPMPEGDLVLDDNLDLLVLFERYNTLKLEQDHIKSQMDSIRDTLVTFAPDRTVTCRGHKVVYKKGTRRTDYKKACTDAQLDTTAYEKIGEPSYAITLAKSPFEADA